MTRPRWCHQHGQWDELDGRSKGLMLRTVPACCVTLDGSAMGGVARTDWHWLAEQQDREGGDEWLSQGQASLYDRVSRRIRMLAAIKLLQGKKGIREAMYAMRLRLIPINKDHLLWSGSERNWTDHRWRREVGASHRSSMTNSQTLGTAIIIRPRVNIWLVTGGNTPHNLLHLKRSTISHNKIIWRCCCNP
jgi:hypothetical protein